MHDVMSDAYRSLGEKKEQQTNKHKQNQNENLWSQHATWWHTVWHNNQPPALEPRTMATTRIVNGVDTFRRNHVESLKWVDRHFVLDNNFSVDSSILEINFVWKGQRLLFYSTFRITVCTRTIHRLYSSHPVDWAFVFVVSFFFLSFSFLDHRYSTQSMLIFSNDFWSTQKDTHTHIIHHTQKLSSLSTK